MRASTNHQIKRAFLRLGHRRMLASVDIDRGTAAIGCMSLTCPSKAAHGHLTFSVECSDRLHGSCGKKYCDFFVDEGDVFLDTTRKHSHLEIAISIVAPTLRPAVARFEF